jgi:hypothetical protein
MAIIVAGRAASVGGSMPVPPVSSRKNYRFFQAG